MPRVLATATLSALLAFSAVPAAALADDGDGSSDASDQPLVENSWRYDNGEPIDESEVDGAQSGSASGDTPLLKELASSTAWTWQDSGYVNSSGQIIPDAKLKGIDVSEHQRLIDWDTVASESDIDFVIIRCGYGSNYTSQDDDYWVYNVTECGRLGIPFGVYLYSYATDVDMARSEAAHVLRLLDEVDFTPTYPIYLDMEDNSVLSSGVDAAGLAAIAEAFCTTIEDAGYTAGVYANLNWWTNYLTDPAFDQWERWVAQWGDQCTYTGSYAMWQCTSSGSVPGIEGNVDLNFDMVYRGRSYGAYYDVSASDWVVTEGWFDYVTGASLMKGYSDATGRITGYWGPWDSLTRAEFATILYRYANPDATDTYYDYADNETDFVDNLSGWFYTAAINWASREGILLGYEDGRGNLTGYVGPDDNITREELATMLARFAASLGIEVSGDAEEFAAMPDADEVTEYAVESVAWCVANGIIEGSWADDGLRYINPRDSASRAEAAKMVTVLVRDVLEP